MPGFGDALSSDNVSFEFAQINHYTIRSMSEFDKKMGRGNGWQPVGANEKSDIYLKRFDKADVYQSDILNHLPGYLEVLARIS